VTLLFERVAVSQPQGSEEQQHMGRKGIAALALFLTLTLAAAAQEYRSEVSVQGTGFFTKDSTGNGIRQEATKTGGVLVGYRYNINRWLAAEANYGYDRNTQFYSGAVPARVQANIHQITGSAVVKLPSFAKLQPFVLAGGGGLVFDPTGNPGGTFAGATRETKGAFLYGGGADYRLTHHLALRAEYRGLVYKGSELQCCKFGHRQIHARGAAFRWNRVPVLAKPDTMAEGCTASLTLTRAEAVGRAVGNNARSRQPSLPHAVL
jgi:opacity protein-like surface antigen